MRKEQARKSGAAVGQGLGSPQGIHRKIWLSHSADTESPSRWEKLTVCCPQAGRPQTNWNRRMMRLTPTFLTANQSEECSWADHTLSEPLRWNTLPRPPGQHTQFEGIRLLRSSLPGRAIKLFFSTSPQTLSLRFNLVLGYRGLIWPHYEV